jgi:ribosomal protein S16
MKAKSKPKPIKPRPVKVNVHSWPTFQAIVKDHIKKNGGGPVTIIGMFDPK